MKKASKTQEIKDWISEANEEALFADGFDEAILGMDSISGRVIYSVNKMIKILMKNDNMTYEDAREYLDFNTIGAHVGEMTPIYMEGLT